MSRFRKVDAGMWGDARFCELSEDGKLLWLYLLTGPEVTNLPGLIVAGRAHLAEAMGWAVERFDSAFAEFGATPAHPVPMAKADWSRRVVWLPKAFKHNRPANTNVLVSWRDHWRTVPECPLKAEAFLALRSFAEALGPSYLALFENHMGNQSGMVPPIIAETLPRVRASAPAPAPAPVSEGVQGEVPDGESRVRLRSAAVAPAAESVFPMPDDFPLTAEARAAASELEVRDIDAEWAKFRAHQIKTGTASTARGWYQGGWRKWIVDAVKYQRRERERDAARGNADPSTPPTKGAQEHPLALRPRERTMTATEHADAARRLQAALRAGEPASTDDGEARHAV